MKNDFELVVVVLVNKFYLILKFKEFPLTHVQSPIRYVDVDFENIQHLLLEDNYD